MDRSRRGPSTANPREAPSSNEEVHSDDEIFREIEEYVTEDKRVQAGDPPYTCLNQTSDGRREQVRPGAPSL